MDSPVGRLLLAATPAGVVRLAFAREGDDAVLEDLAQRISPRVLEAPARLDAARRQLDEYFGGGRTTFELPLDWRLSHGFRARVLHAIAAIPYGSTGTYRSVATAAGTPERRARGGHRLRHEPDPDHRPVPPRGALGRDDGPLRRRRGGEADAARARARAAMRLAPFQEVVERHGRDVMRLCIAVAGPGAADDCYQETMLAALAAYPRLRDPSVTRSWLLTIASRKAIDGFRASARTVPVAEPDAGATEDAEPPDAELWARVRSLPPKQRVAVAYRFVLDLAYREIGEAMEHERGGGAAQRPRGPEAPAGGFDLPGKPRAHRPGPLSGPPRCTVAGDHAAPHEDRRHHRPRLRATPRCSSAWSRPGMDVARLNFSHGSAEEHAETARRVRDAAGRAGRQVAILQDLPGPKLRIGQLRDGIVELKPGDGTTFVCGDQRLRGRRDADVHHLGRARRRPSSAGEIIYLADGAVRLRVTGDAARATARSTPRSRSAARSPRARA